MTYSITARIFARWNVRYWSLTLLRGLIVDTAGVSLLRGRCPAVMRSPWMCRRSWLRASLLLWLVRSSRGPCVYVAYFTLLLRACVYIALYFSHYYCVHVCMSVNIFDYWILNIDYWILIFEYCACFITNFLWFFTDLLGIPRIESPSGFSKNKNF